MSVYQIFPLALARYHSPAPRVFYLGDPKQLVPTVNLFWLLKSHERTVLVDTGFDQAAIDRFSPGMPQTPEQHPIQLLAAHGVRPEEIDLVILTHVHWDHLSTLVHRYSRARVVLNRREYEFATTPPHPWFGELIDQQTLAALAAQGPPRFELLAGEGEVAPGLSVIDTPGHTYGHQSVLVDTASGRACITADACLFYHNLEADVGPGFNCNLIECMASLARLRRLRDAGVVILPGHDPAIFERHPTMPIL